MNPLVRYESLVDDPDAFRVSCERPLPTVVRVNTLKTSVDRTRAALDEEGVAHEPVPWADNLLELPDGRPGTSWPYFHGWLHGQEAVSALPPLALDPGSGDRILAACAAPGGKATQAAAMMDDRGFVLANDANLGRLSALRHNAERLGVTAMAVTNRDARHLTTDEWDFDAFDGALVDVPCSCEGTVRKNPDVVDEWTIEHVRSLVGLQEAILQRAVERTRPGGTVVYSTCTFAPEENETVVDAVLERGDCEVVPWEPPLDAEPGLTEWEGESFDESLRHARRVYPHQNDTGGFFCATMEVTG